MKTIMFAVLSTASILAISAPAFAADLLEGPPPVVYDEPAGSWEGPYVGAYLEGLGLSGGTTSLGGEFGYNFSPAETFLLGLQISGAINLDASNPVTTGWLTGKIGFTTEQFAVYALGAVGVSSDSADTYSKVGLGGEFKLDDNWGIDGEIASVNNFGASSVDGTLSVQVGVRYHF